jgi:hypothetical protein
MSKQRPDNTLCLCRVLCDNDFDLRHFIIDIVKEKRQLKFSMYIGEIGREEIDFSMICQDILLKCVSYSNGLHSEKTARINFDGYKLDVLKNNYTLFPFRDMYGILDLFDE